MTALEVKRIPYGWRIDLGDHHVDAERPHIARGVVRAIVTAQNGTTLYHRDSLNLTSERMRRRFLRVLDEKQVSIPEHVLLAPEEACRTRPLPPVPDTAQHDGTNERSAEDPERQQEQPLPYSDYSNARALINFSTGRICDIATRGKAGSCGRGRTGHAIPAVS